jgi:N-acyl-D-aspartate/D-glutamate deacylase
MLERTGIAVAVCGCAIVGLLLRGSSKGLCPHGRPYDLVLANGLIVDGFGGPGRRGSVAICHDRIVAVGEVSGEALRRVDVRGQVIAPGFIDALGQSEIKILENGDAASKVTQGITSEITGEVESVWPRAATAGAGGPSWESLNEYATDLEASGTAINIGTLVAAGSLWAAVMPSGDARASPAQVSQMAALVGEGMRDGAFGVAAGLLYPPSTLLAEVQLTTLAAQAAQYGGVYAVHLRSESDSVLEAAAEALRIGESSGAPVHIHHLKVAGKKYWAANARLLAMLDSARGAGVKVSADMYPYEASSTSLIAMLPAWARRGAPSDVQRRLESGPIRERIIATLESREVRPQAISLMRTRAPAFAGFGGRRLDEIADRVGRAPLVVLLDILEADQAGTAALIFGMSQGNVDSVAVTPWVSLGTDAGALSSAVGENIHPRTFGTFARFYSRYVRQLRIVRLEDAVSRMTLLPARQFGVPNRGCLAAGAYADIVVFDGSRFEDRATYTKPWLPSAGISEVVVNGQAVIQQGRLTDARPGRFLRNRHWETVHAKDQRPVDGAHTLSACDRAVPGPGVHQ